jgi:cytochrome b subunit of formate dehydrogenase
LQIGRFQIGRLQMTYWGLVAAAVALAVSSGLAIWQQLGGNLPRNLALGALALMLCGVALGVALAA